MSVNEKQSRYVIVKYNNYTTDIPYILFEIVQDCTIILKTNNVLFEKREVLFQSLNF